RMADAASVRTSLCGGYGLGAALLFPLVAAVLLLVLTKGRLSYKPDRVVQSAEARLLQARLRNRGRRLSCLVVVGCSKTMSDPTGEQDGLLALAHSARCSMLPADGREGSIYENES